MRRLIPTSRPLLPRILVLLLVASLSTAAPAQVNDGDRLDPGPMVSANAFMDSVGVSVHWEYKDGVYGKQVDAIAAAVVQLGVRHVRGYDPAISPRLARSGVGAMLVAGPEVGLPQQIAQTVANANAKFPVIDTVEGSNEADLFWPLHHYSYHEQGFPAGTLAYQHDLYAAIRSRPELNAVQVIGPSLGRTYLPGPLHGNPYAGGGLADAVDLGNFHPYPFGGNSFSLPFPYDSIARYYWTGNFPSANLDEYPYAFLAYAPPFAPRPMAATETGYPTWRNGVTEAVQAKYIPRLVAEYCRLGIRRAYLYELVDDMPDPDGNNQDSHFGLMRNDLSRKPAFTALQSLLAVVAPEAGSPNGGLSQDLPAIGLAAHMPSGLDRPRYVHSLIVRRSPDEAVLLLWHEVASADTASSPPRTIRVPAGRVDISAHQSWQVAAWFDYDAAWRLDRHDVSAATPLVSVPLRDQVVAVLLRRGA